MRTTLFINYYPERSIPRRSELDRALWRNLENPLIGRVLLLLEGPPRFEHSKLTHIPLSSRPTVRQFFKAINEHGAADDVNVFCNSDIYFDESLALVHKLDLKNRCLALTRWDVQADGSLKFLGTDDSQDAWIFKGHIKPVGGCDVSLGTPGVDWRTAAELRNSGYEVLNPSRDIRAIHLHLCAVRRYSNLPMTPGPYAHVVVCGVDDVVPRQPKRGVGVIAFSLFGDRPRYTVGAVENAILARYIYPDWTCRFYVDDSVPSGCIARLRDAGAQIVSMPRQTHPLQGTFWRFLVADDPGFNRWIVRDVDSRLGYRERRAVDEWIALGAPFHIMRDHPWHTVPAIVASAFGGVRGVISDMAGKINRWTKLGYYGADEEFLAEVIYPLVKDVALQHASFSDEQGDLVRPFPTAFEDYRFVGERIREDGSPVADDRQMLIDALTQSLSEEQAANL